MRVKEEEDAVEAQAIAKIARRNLKRRGRQREQIESEKCEIPKWPISMLH